MKQSQTEKSLLSLRLDAVLNLYFCKEENREQLRQFLKATTPLTDDDLATIEIKNPKLTKLHVQEKDFIVDIRLTSSTGKQINIEMQIQKHANFIDRMVAYNARQYASQLKKGDKYTRLKSSISLIIVDFPLFHDSTEFSEHIFFRRENRKIFTTAQQFCIIDLTKLPGILKDDIHMWGALFKVQTEKELKKLMEQSETMQSAGKKLLELSADESAREIANAREESQWAWEDTLASTEEAGYNRGLEQGI